MRYDSELKFRWEIQQVLSVFVSRLTQYEELRGSGFHLHSLQFDVMTPYTLSLICVRACKHEYDGTLGRW